jgi:hypothetical protein
VAVQKGVPGVVVLNDAREKDDVTMEVALKASEIVERFRDQIQLDDE